MSERENLISRWGRLKRESQSRKKREAEARESAGQVSAAGTIAAKEAEKGEECVGTDARPTATIDPSSLPSIDSIAAGTDMSIFLQPGVPAKLTEAALRRAWVSDPRIRDFVGIAENQWDFTNPTTIPGFGPLRETGDKLNLLAQATGMLDRSLDRFPGRRSDTDASAEDTRSATGDARRDEVEETAGETQPASATRVADSEMSNAAPENGRVVATAQTTLSSGSTRPRRRRHAHGGALPR
jgi:Protein of unknown function (DUF3306)